jgi:hypothetical protein
MMKKRFEAAKAAMEAAKNKLRPGKNATNESVLSQQSGGHNGASSRRPHTPTPGPDQQVESPGINCDAVDGAAPFTSDTGLAYEPPRPLMTLSIHEETVSSELDQAPPTEPLGSLALESDNGNECFRGTAELQGLLWHLAERSAWNR